MLYPNEMEYPSFSYKNSLEYAESVFQTDKFMLRRCEKNSAVFII